MAVWEIPEMFDPEKLVPKPDAVVGDVAVYRKDGIVLLILLSRRVCCHRTPDGDYERHVRYYVTTDRPDRELERLVEWLDAGFWWDSWCIEPQPIVEQFIKGGCMSPQHFGRG